MKTQLKWNKSGAMLSTALIGAVVLAGCPKGDGDGGGGGGIFGGGGGGGSLATVNGEPIERSVLHSHLEATGGTDALRQLIDYELVMQELKNKKLDVTEAEVDAAVAQRSRENAQIAEAVANGGAQQEALKRQVRYQLAIDKLLTIDVKVDEAKLKAWFDKAKARYDQPERAKIGFLITTQKARADTMAQQLKSKSKTFLELVTEQKAAKDVQAQASLAEIPEFTPTSNLPKELRVPLSKLKSGETSGVLTLGEGPQKVFAIIRLVERQEGKKADMTSMRSQLENEYKLEEVARTVVKENPTNPPFDETLKRVEGAIMQRAMQERRPPSKPTHHDLLNFINQARVSEMIAQLHKTAKIEITDKAYKKLGEELKAAAEMAPPPGAGGPGGPGGAPSGGPGEAPSGGAPSQPAPSGSAEGKGGLASPNSPNKTGR